MKSNIGVFGKMFRFYLALILFVSAIIFKGEWLFLISLFVLYESLSGWCAVNQILGKNSCPLKGHDAPETKLLKSYQLGIAVLILAIILNTVATYLGLMTWYEFLSPNSMSDLGITDVLFLFIVYPLSLGIVIKRIK